MTLEFCLKVKLLCYIEQSVLSNSQIFLLSFLLLQDFTNSLSTGLSKFWQTVLFKSIISAKGFDYHSQPQCFEMEPFIYYYRSIRMFGVAIYTPNWAVTIVTLCLETTISFHFWSILLQGQIKRVRYTSECTEYWRMTSFGLFTTIQSGMNVKVSHQRVWPCHQNELIKIIPIIAWQPY